MVFLYPHPPETKCATIRKIAPMKLKKKKLNPTVRVCLRLTALREERGVSLQSLAKKLRISKEHLHLLETCQFDELPFAPVYQKNLIKSYIEALGEEPKSFVDQFVFEEIHMKRNAAPVYNSGKRGFDTSYLPGFLRAGSIALLVFVVIGYLVVQVRNIVEPPNLVIYTPQDGLITHEPAITVHGKTDSEAQIQINGRNIAGNEEGFFEEKLTLTEGVNTLVFMAKKKHGKVTAQTHHIVYKADGQLSFQGVRNKSL